MAKAWVKGLQKSLLLAKVLLFSIAFVLTTWAFGAKKNPQKNVRGLIWNVYVISHTVHTNRCKHSRKHDHARSCARRQP